MESEGVGGEGWKMCVCGGEGEWGEEGEMESVCGGMEGRESGGGGTVTHRFRVLSIAN